MTIKASHLRREVRTALELALAAFAPTQVLDGLARSAGYLEGLSEFPLDNPVVTALVNRVEAEAKSALQAWKDWSAAHVHSS